MRPVTGVLAEWMALYLSFATFSPQPSKMQTSTGFLFLRDLVMRLQSFVNCHGR